MPDKPVLVGITGGIGAGKSVVCEVFKALQVPVYDADSRARALMQESEEVVASIREHFGAQAYLPSGQLDRAYLAARVFPNRENLNKINSIVHPAVERDFMRWVTSHSGAKYVLKEAALLVETGSYKKLDALVVVTAPENLRIQRVLKRDKHRSEEDIRAIIGKQLAEEKKVKAAGFVINNDEKALLIPQILKIHDFFINFE